MAKDLTAEIVMKLSRETVEGRRTELTSLNSAGFNIRPYLEQMLSCPDGVHCGPEDNGFKRTTFSTDTLFLYSLNDWKENNGRSTIFFYQLLPDGTYKRWPN